MPGPSLPPLASQLHKARPTDVHPAPHRRLCPTVKPLENYTINDAKDIKYMQPVYIMVGDEKGSPVAYAEITVQLTFVDEVIPVQPRTSAVGFTDATKPVVTHLLVVALKNREKCDARIVGALPDAAHEHPFRFTVSDRQVFGWPAVKEKVARLNV